MEKIKCEICGKEFKIYNQLSKHITSSHSITTQNYYDMYLKVDADGVCPVCGKSTVFLNLVKGYRKHCSVNCSSLDSNVINKSKQTRLIKYGDENFTNREKSKQTCLDKYGKEFYTETEDYLLKVKQTNQEKYGCDFYLQTDKCKQDSKITKLNKYGSETFNNAEQALNTKINKHGSIENYYNFVKEKSDYTKLERYGDVNYNNRDKFKQTSLERYGIDNPAKLDTIKQKRINTCLEKYNAVSNLCTDEFKEQSKNTFLEKYGVTHPSQIESVKSKAKETIRDKVKNFTEINQCTAVVDLLRLYGQSWYKNKIAEVIYDDDTNRSFIPNDKIELIQRWHEETKLDVSGLEQSIRAEIQKFYSGNLIKTRSIIPPYEIDLYCEELKIGIECNGLYWHSTLCNPNKYYHELKSKLSEQLGVRLIHIYEYEWNNPILRNKIISLLRIAFNCAPQRIYARDCTIQQITNSQAREFNNLHHLQNHRNAQVTYGLFYKNELVQLMSFSKTKYNKNLKNDNEWEIIRGCPGSNNIVVGGVSKLFKHFIRDYNPSKVFSYCDFNKFNGAGYEALGMEFIGYTGPDLHWWLNDGRVVARNPNKHKEYKENSIAQIWGAGSKKYLWTNISR